MSAFILTSSVILKMQAVHSPTTWAHLTSTYCRNLNKDQHLKICVRNMR